MVLLDRSVSGVQTDLVHCDSKEGAYQLVKHLVELGHEQISIITGPEGVSTSDDRIAGYLQALSEAGLSDNQRIYFGTFTQASGYELTTQTIAENPAPTAIFGANNFISIGILKALRDAAIPVPEEIAVVGFDDLPTALIVDPFLTVAAQPAYKMGQKATELLLTRLSGESPDDFQEIILPTEIIERQSSGPPQNKS